MNLLTFLYVGYLFIPLAVIVMLANYRQVNKLWPVLLAIGMFTGIGMFVAMAYLVNVFIFNKNSTPGQSSGNEGGIVYRPDGSYTVYKADGTKSSSSSAGRTAFRIAGGLVGGIVICYGLFVVGFFVLVAVSCSGNSKCM